MQTSSGTYPLVCSRVTDQVQKHAFSSRNVCCRGPAVLLDHTFRPLQRLCKLQPIVERSVDGTSLCKTYFWAARRQCNPPKDILVCLEQILDALHSLQDLCDLDPFIERSINGMAPSWRNFCMMQNLASSPCIPGKMKSTSQPVATSPWKFSQQWIYFHRNSTMRQIYGEFYSTVHETQVCCPLYARGTGFDPSGKTGVYNGSWGCQMHEVGTCQRSRVHVPRDRASVKLSIVPLVPKPGVRLTPRVPGS